MKLRTVILVALFLSLTGSAAAHPMGNFSINQIAQIRLNATEVRVVYIVDFAEIPSFQMFSKDRAGEVERLAKTWASQLTMQFGSDTVPLKLVDVRSQDTPGQGGLKTVKAFLTLQAPWNGSQTSMIFRNGNFTDRLGWKDIVVESDRSIGFPDGNPYFVDRTRGLTEYPSDPLADTPSRQSLSIAVLQTGVPSTAGDMTTSTFGSTKSGVPDRLSALLQSPTLPLGVVLLGLAFAFSLGALHALSPGHGKTIVAAYLVGNRGTARHAFYLGGIVTFSHTIGVFVLGLITLLASQYIVPDRLYPWLGFLSGVMIVVIGAGLLRQRLRQLTQRSSEETSHTHGGSTHSHGEGTADHSHDIPEKITLRTLTMLGISGGIIPCPSALVVLLSAVALHRIGLGLLLIVAFSFGLASVLVGIGIVVVRAQSLFSRFGSAGRLATLMPIVSAAIITVIGVGVSFQSISGFGR